ncbi:hypothetical protein SAMN05444410_101538 [Hydrobacter penzbergensis]|uniref:Pectate lyase superfamily protein n=2 Tax=Pseudomonadati TaxID=3379134 RepID=A0A8X8I966_9BACT|nr:hypothetical protein [Hydrobacter penzbergensis]SDW21711.1 hypothetical protein SAMN05444410_101538 [Hydrobacter penzbergensis]
MIFRQLARAACICCSILSTSFITLDTGSHSSSKFVKLNADGSLVYMPDEKGNTIPDFSRVGFYGGDRSIPDIPIVKTISATGADDQQLIQQAIDEVSNRPLDATGFRGAILLKRGLYKIATSLRLEASGVILRGEGNTENGTRIQLTAATQMPLLRVTGSGTPREIPGTRTQVTDNYVPAGTHSLTVSDATRYKAGDKVMVFRPATKQWIQDLKMDQIEGRDGTKQWQPDEYNLSFERVITKIEGNKVFIDNPIVMPMEPKYGTPIIFKYEFPKRINHVGIEQLFFQSDYSSDTAENHGWQAILCDRIENSWIRNVSSRYFGYACVELGSLAKHISVLNSNCLDAKSVITGGRRYSFCNNGQLNLFMNCHTTEGRHDFVTGARVCGPNVFYNCTAQQTHADIGPHHRWASGTLYDNIVTDGEINVQDRGNYGSGHGWAGVTQIVWNCTAKNAAVQSPWVSGKNYCIGLKGKKSTGRFKDRPDGEWELMNQTAEPASLYMAQLKARQR